MLLISEMASFRYYPSHMSESFEGLCVYLVSDIHLWSPDSEFFSSSEFLAPSQAQLLCTKVSICETQIVCAPLIQHVHGLRIDFADEM